MVNKVAKGRRAEKEFADWLSYGYYVWRPTWNRYGSKDIFCIADIIAIRKGNLYNITFPPNHDLLFVQVKTNRSDFYKARKVVKNFIKDLTIYNNIIFVVALKIKGKKWRIWQITTNGEEYDTKEVINNAKR